MVVGKATAINLEGLNLLTNFNTVQLYSLYMYYMKLILLKSINIVRYSISFLTLNSENKSRN